MTDKELRKLSRLELLELLLKESKENEKLRAETEKLKNENSLIRATEQLKETSVQMEETLRSANMLTALLQNLTSEKEAEKKEDSTDSAAVSFTVRADGKKKKSPDAELYKRLMLFFGRNIQSLSYLPDDLRKDIAKRLTEILVSK